MDIDRIRRQPRTGDPVDPQKIARLDEDRLLGEVELYARMPNEDEMPRRHEDRHLRIALTQRVRGDHHRIAGAGKIEDRVMPVQSTSRGPSLVTTW